MFDEIKLGFDEWAYLANGLVTGASIQLYRKRQGELIWQSADDEVDDRLAAHALSEILRERDLLGSLAADRPRSSESDRWPRWKERVDRSKECSVTIRLGDISHSDGHFAQAIKDSPEARLDVPIAYLLPSRALRILNSVARIYILDNTKWVPPRDRWGNEDPFVAPSYRSKLAKSFGPKSRTEAGRLVQAKYVLEDLAAEFEGKKMAKLEAIEVFENFNCTTNGAKSIWRDAELPDEWRKSGRIAELDRIPGEELAKRLKQKGITTLSNK